MTIYNRILISCFIFLVLILNGWAQETIIEDPLEFSNSRLSALGGYHAALADDIMTIFNNPAGFSSIESEFLISELTLGITGPVFDITGSLLNADDLMTELIDLMQGLYASIDLVGPISIAFAGSGISFGLFNWADVSFQPRGALNLEAIVQENLLFTGGYCFRIPIKGTTLDIGLQLKAILRGTVTSYNSIIELAGAVMGDGDYLALIMDEDFLLSMGGGLDMGILYSIGDLFSYGLVARNIFSPTIRSQYTSLDSFLNDGSPVGGEGIIPLDLSTGIQFSPPLGILDRYISDFKVLLDYNDILDFLTHPATAKHWLLHLSLAMELNLLEKLSLRGGFSQGLFCAGLGLNLSVFQINASMFGSELSGYPGLRPAYNMVIGFEFKL